MEGWREGLKNEWRKNNSLKSCLGSQGLVSSPSPGAEEFLQCPPQTNRTIPLAAVYLNVLLCYWLQQRLAITLMMSLSSKTLRTHSL